MSDTTVIALLDKLNRFRSALPADERQLLDGILLAASGRQDDVQAYSLDAAAVQQAAFGAVVGFGLFMGSLSAPPTAQAQIGEIEAPASHPSMVSGIPSAVMSISVAPSVSDRDDNENNPRPRA
jgi:hypothetical protein